MAKIAVNPFILKDCLFQVESDSYEAHVSQVQFDPESNSVAWKGLTPEAVFTFASHATWKCTIAFAQDWTTPNSLSRYLFEHDGDEIDVVFEPVAGGPSVTAVLVVTPGAIGGAIDSVATSTVTLAVKGKPALAAIATP